jgi:hypothetical protein
MIENGDRVTTPSGAPDGAPSAVADPTIEHRRTAGPSTRADPDAVRARAQELYETGDAANDSWLTA